MSGRPTPFVDLPPESFPFDVQFVAIRTGAVVLEITVTGPGVIAVPNLSTEHGPILTRTRWPDGSILEHTPGRLQGAPTARQARPAIAELVAEGGWSMT